MAKKRRHPRPATRAGDPVRSDRASRQEQTEPSPRSTAQRTGADPARRARKDAARRAREAERKRAARSWALRRMATITLIGVFVVGVFVYLNRAASARPIPAAAVAAAKAAGCSSVSTPTNDPVRTHLDSGQSYTYPQKPATSGPHDPSPWGIDPRVNAGPIPETRAVHSLEHGEVILYYRASGDGALPSDVLDALKAVANVSKNTLLAPYPDLRAGQSFDLTAWNKLQTCPGTITAAQARAVASGFEYAFSCTGNAPESKAAGNGC